MSQYSDLILSEPGLVSYWRLGELSGTTAADSKGTDTGTLVNSPTLGTAGLIANDTNAAMTFLAASSQHITLGNTGGGFGNGPYTMELWFSMSASGANFAMLDLQALTGASGDIGLGMGNLANGKVSVTDGGNRIISSGATLYNDGKRHHVVATKIVAGNVWKLYIDGVDVTTADSFPTQTTTSGATTNGRIGVQYNAGTQRWFFTGTLDEVAIYNVDIGLAGAQRHFAAGTDPSTNVYPLMTRPWMPGALRYFALPPLTPDISASSLPSVTGISDVAFSWLSDVPTVGWVEGSDTPALLPVLNPTLPGGPFGWLIRPTYPSFDFVVPTPPVSGTAASSFSWLSDVPTTGWVEGSDTPPLLPVLNPTRPFPFWFIQQSGPPPDSVTPTPPVSGAAALAFGWSTTLAGWVEGSDTPPLMPVLNPTRPGGPFSWMLPPIPSFAPDTLAGNVTGVAASVFSWTTSASGLSLPNVTGTSAVTFTWSTSGYTADINAPDQDVVDRRRMKEWYFPNDWPRNDMFRKSFGH